MDLKKYLKEPEQLKPDFGWWIDAETFDVEGNARNPHECKDELTMQWGEDGYIIETNDNNIPVIRQSSRKESIQASIILQTRSMMNAGIKTASIRNFLAKHQKPELIKACSSEIDRQLRLEGCVGRFVLDARGYKNCAEALKFASKNPFRKYMNFVIGCTCDNHIKSKTYKAGSMISTGDPIGDYMNNNQTSSETITETCPKTGMQVLSGQGDIDSQWAGNTMIDVMNACDLDKDTTKGFTASKEQPYLRLKRFFIALDEGNFKKQAEDFDINKEQNEDINSAPLGVKIDENLPIADIDMNKKDNESICFKLNKDAAPEEKLDVNVDSLCFNVNEELPKEETLVVKMMPMISLNELEKDREPDLPVNLPMPETNTFEMNRETKKDLEINSNQAPVVVDNFENQDEMAVEFGIPADDEFFKDSGEIILDEKPSDNGMSFSF